MTLFQITGYAKSHLTALGERSEGTPMKGFSARHTCFFKVSLISTSLFSSCSS